MRFKYQIKLSCKSKWILITYQWLYNHHKLKAQIYLLARITHICQRRVCLSLIQTSIKVKWIEIRTACQLQVANSGWKKVRLVEPQCQLIPREVLALRIHFSVHEIWLYKKLSLLGWKNLVSEWMNILHRRMKCCKKKFR
jgi:hypothetical protein